MHGLAGLYCECGGQDYFYGVNVFRTLKVKGKEKEWLEIL